MDTTKDTTLLNSLIQTVYDSVKGYEESSRDVDSPQLKDLFHQGATERAKVSQDLRDEVERLGGEPTYSPSTLGDAHRGFMKLRELISAREDKAIIAEVERGEDYIKEKFEVALESGGLAPDTRSAVERAYATIKTGHDRARDLKLATGA